MKASSLVESDNRMAAPIRLYLLAFLVFPVGCVIADETFKRTEDVVYGRKYGTALTLDVFTPNAAAGKQPNGAAVVFVVSGGYFSSHEAINIGFVSEFLNRGYTVFAVVHGSQPKFTIPEILDDIHRSIRFIRSRSNEYHIDPNRIGICGASAGGHISLMQGTAGTPGNPEAKDPVERESSRVQAVACLFPPTDFMNYGKSGDIALGFGLLKDFRAPFDFHELDKATRTFVPIVDVARVVDIGKKISPINHVSSDDAPTLIVHGDSDKLVPHQQAEIIIQKFKDVGVSCELVTRQGKDHGWAGIDKEFSVFADWFDKHLAKK